MTPSTLPRALAIVGPTASGKAALGQTVAQTLGLPIFVCDSVKVYRGLDIGSAKPSAQARASVPHVFLDLVEPAETFSAGAYARAVHDHWQGPFGLFVGGTGFYLRAAVSTFSADACDGASSVDEACEARAAFDATWLAREAQEPGALAAALAAQDPVLALNIDAGNRVRLLRALWLGQQLGTPLSTVRARHPPKPRVQLLTLVLDPPRDVVADAVAVRVDRMLAAGWLDEVAALLRRGVDASAHGMRTLGYRQLTQVLAGGLRLPDARDDIVIKTRQYAKRQRTFFRHQRMFGLRAQIGPEPEQFPWTMVRAFMEGDDKAAIGYGAQPEPHPVEKT